MKKILCQRFANRQRVNGDFTQAGAPVNRKPAVASGDCSVVHTEQFGSFPGSVKKRREIGRRRGYEMCGYCVRYYGASFHKCKTAGWAKVIIGGSRFLKMGKRALMGEMPP